MFCQFFLRFSSNAANLIVSVPSYQKAETLHAKKQIQIQHRCVEGGYNLPGKLKFQCVFAYVLKSLDNFLLITHVRLQLNSLTFPSFIDNTNMTIGGCITLSGSN